MSEYQYYEFMAVDEDLDERQQAELRALSTRADITPTRFVNEYHWGDFRGNPAMLMERYFDAHLYIANWGTHQFMLRLPESLLKLETAESYCFTEAVSARRHGEHVILDFCSDDESGRDWDESDETRLGELISIRADLAAGDHRALYLAWLFAAQTELDSDELEPPVPPGLTRLTGPLRALAAFLRIDKDFLAVAAEASMSSAGDRPDAEFASFVTSLPLKEKDELLVRAASGDPRVSAELRQRFRRLDAETSSPGARTVGELIDAAAARNSKRREQAARRAAQERARSALEVAEARKRRWDGIAADPEKIWREVHALIETKRPADYDSAVGHLADLRAVSARTGDEATFTERYGRLREEHRRKSSLMQRLDDAGL